MPQEKEQKPDRLRLYYEAEQKYHTLPVPTPLDRGAAVDFVNEHLSDDVSYAHLGKLSGLALFYDLGETADGFAGLLKKTETDRTSYARSAVVLITLAWVGDDARVATARQYYRRMLHRAEVDRDRQVMLQTCDAFGGEVGTKELREWLQTEIDALEKEAADLGQQGDENGAFMVRNRLNQVEEFLKFSVPDIDAANVVRKEIEDLAKPEEQIRRLARAYLPDGRDVLAQVEGWAGIKLLHLAAGRPRLQGLMGSEFARLAKRYGQQDPKRQEELDLKRAKCLRAAEYFGYALDAEHAAWLADQRDHGADLIALRPNWEYPALLAPDEAP
ncbi:MAG: hypothetical protein IID40_05820 [Planctomycetes bacterium]|nr:hypothetical protein [Planctomycetota bacterium]